MFLRSLVEDLECREWIVRNEEARRRAGTERELARRADQIREYRDGLGMWKEWMSTVWPEGC